MRDYGKVYATFWSSGTTSKLSDDGKLLALYLMTCSHATIAGVFRLPDGYVAEDLSWDQARVSKGFAELFSNGFADRCAITKWVWIRKHLEWNKPENPNQRKSAAKIALSVPDECAWKLDFIEDSSEILGIEDQAQNNRSATVGKQFLNQKQEQKQEQEYSSPDGEGDKPAGAGVVDPCPHQQIIDAYHRILPMGRQVREWTPARAAALRSRWRDNPKRQSVEWWERFFGYVAKSDFLTGKTQSGDRRPFEVSLDWLVKSENMAKVIEGAYHEAEKEAA